MLPSNSFMKVGMILGKNEDSNVIEYEKNITKDDDDIKYDNDINCDNSEMILSKGAIIMEGPLSESKELTIETMDVETFGEMYSYLKRRNWIYTGILFILIMTNAISIYYLHIAQEREQTLNMNLEKVVIENTKLMEQITIFDDNDSTNKQEKCLCYDDHAQEQCNDNPLLFEVNNCYFNVQTSATLGQCSKDIQSTMQHWYNLFVYESYVTFWEEYFGQKSDENGSNGTTRTDEHSTAGQIEPIQNEIDQEPSSIEDFISFII